MKVLCAAAAAGIVVSFADLLAAEAPHRRLFGVELSGEVARAAATAEIGLLALGAWGLWNLRSWARSGAMLYLAAVCVRFLFFGVEAGGRSQAVWTLLWQVSMVPFATFGFMFLYNGGRYFSHREPGSYAGRSAPQRGAGE